MKTKMLAAAVAGVALIVSPTFAQAPNDAAATLSQGKAYTDSKAPASHHSASAHRTGRHGGVRSAASTPGPDHSADQLNQQQLDQHR